MRRRDGVRLVRLVRLAVYAGDAGLIILLSAVYRIIYTPDRNTPFLQHLYHTSGQTTDSTGVGRYLLLFWTKSQHLTLIIIRRQANQGHKMHRKKRKILEMY